MIDPVEVEMAFFACLFTNEEADDPDLAATAIPAEGIVETVGFFPARLEEHRGKVTTWLGELPESFRAPGGASFVGACYDRHGEQWTGLQQRMMQLFQLGIALGMVRSVLPRELWSRLPEGVPWYSITLPTMVAANPQPDDLVRLIEIDRLTGNEQPLIHYTGTVLEDNPELWRRSDAEASKTWREDNIVARYGYRIEEHTP